MIYLQETSRGRFEVLQRNVSPLRSKNTKHPWNIFDHWSDEQLATASFYKIDEKTLPAAPPGKRIESSEFKRVKGEIKRIDKYVDLTTTAGEEAPVTIDTIKYELKRDVQNKISARRSRVLTYLPGQDMIYSKKREEAILYLGALQDKGKPSEKDYPFLSAAAKNGAEGPSMKKIAENWLKRSEEVYAALAELEAQRVSVKMAIDAAKTEKAARQAAAKVLSP